MRHLHIYTIIAIVLLSLFSCNNVPKNVKQTLELAGENKKELQAVINHYQKPKDSLKLKAAYFLIGNMGNKHYYPNTLAEKRMVFFLDSLFKIEKYKRKEWLLPISLSAYWAKIKKEYSSNKTSPVLDINSMTSKMLIENIETAFDMWEKAPWANRFSFEEFCEYVLPYRNDYDIPSQWRKKTVQKFEWVLDSIKKGDLLYACEQINDSLNISYWNRGLSLSCYYWHESFEEFKDMTIDDMFNAKFGTCRQHSSLKIAALRALGIPIAQVEALHGTSWVIVPDMDGKFWGWENIHLPKKGNPLIGEMRGKRYSKVFMLTYEIQPNPFVEVPHLDIPPLFLKRNYKDVTKDHANTMDVTIELSMTSPQKTNFAYLCEFNSNTKNWEAAHWSRINNNKVQFDQMGVERIYLPMYYFNQQYYQAGKPIYLNKNKEIIVLNTDLKTKDSLKIFRKTPLNFAEHRYAELMLNNTFEGSNTKDFTNSTELFEIKNKPFYMEKKETYSEEKFRYVRYHLKNTVDFGEGYTGMHVASIGFHGENGQLLKGKPISSKVSQPEYIYKAFDQDIRTNFDENNNCWIGLDLGTSSVITKVEYLFRNSFNTIEPNDEYELLYWNNGWESLGKQFAKDNYLEFIGSKNVVLWLRNLTKGKAEMIFYMKDGKQIWG